MQQQPVLVWIEERSSWPKYPLVATLGPHLDCNEGAMGRTLFWGAGAGLAAADFSVACTNLSSGGRELNPVMQIWGRSSLGLAVNFVVETKAVVGASHFFQRKDHNRLERLTSLIHIAGSPIAVSYGVSR